MIRRAAGLLLLGALGALPLNAQDTWNWKKAVPAGQAIEIKGVNGDIVAEAASGSTVEVVARKRGDRSDPSSVRIEVVEHSGGVTICAVYPHRRGDRPNECLAGAKGRSSTHDNDVEVDFEVRVPRGVLFTGRTVNGGVRAGGMTADVKATTVNGDVRVRTTGLVQASTVNGGIEARVGRANWSDELAFKTVNGDITLELPASLSADVSASTVNGSLSSDWPMTMRGRWGPRQMNGKIGEGGRELKLTTVNGDIQLVRAN